jgi:2,3-bisphosphoglycerate-independent phosphoglycerate mutase
VKNTALLILDGWGINPNPTVSAIAAAKTPFFDTLIAQYPNATLTTHSEEVGLPDGQMGNSEVGHLNIGAGRVVYQDLARINKAAKTNELANNPALNQAIQLAKQNNTAFHLIGLVSDGGVHSHINHLLSLCDILADSGLTKIYIHAFTDGRDCSPTSGATFIKQLLNHIKEKPIHLASIIGRYYAMDRDNRWERIQTAYNLLCKGQGIISHNILETIEQFYTQQNLTDEFLPAIVCSPVSLDNFSNNTNNNTENLAHYSNIQNNDVVLCFNFRTDRCREISQVLSQADLPEYQMHKLNIHYFTMCKYDDQFKNVGILFDKDDLNLTLGQVISEKGLTQLRIAETEKYPHVTFFFSGGKEQPFQGESRLIIPSAKVATYDLKPDMSANEITKEAINFINQNNPNLVVLNYANTDMVGHTGVFLAAITAAQTVDNCLSKIVPHLIAQNYQIIIIADHGNADIMINSDGSAHTAHTKNPVPIIYINPTASNAKINNGKLADIAPTILSLMNIDIPAVMNGNIIIQNK